MEESAGPWTDTNTHPDKYGRLHPIGSPHILQKIGLQSNSTKCFFSFFCMHMLLQIACEGLTEGGVLI